MASGHVYRANRPNTWLLRPMLQREDSPCQPGAVHTWPIASFRVAHQLLRFWAGSGHRPRWVSALPPGRPAKTDGRGIASR